MTHVQHPAETGQWFESRDGVRWWFDSGSLALDFAYTGSLGAADGDIADPWEAIASPADLDAWLSTRASVAAADERDVQDARTLRSAIAALTLATAAGRQPGRRDVDVVNLYAATPDLPPRLDGGSRQAGRTAPRASQALSTIARDAVTLFGGDRPGLLRECDAEDCTLLYVDASRARTRRWCSMQRCGNRNKVRRHRARQRAVAQTG